MSEPNNSFSWVDLQPIVRHDIIWDDAFGHPGVDSCKNCDSNSRKADWKSSCSCNRKKYKSDRSEERERHPDAIHLKTSCTGCKKPLDCYWPPMTTFGGVSCTAEEYMAKALQSESVGIYCDDCCEKMPDVNLKDLRINLP